jgi:PmbA protein
MSEVMAKTPMQNRENEWALLEERAAEALMRARELGASAAEVSASSHSGLSVNVRLGEVDTLEHTRDRGVSVTVYRGRCKGVASSADLRVESITSCVDRANDIARFTQEDRCSGVAEAKLMATEFPDLDLWHPRELDVDETIERAIACEQAALDSDARISNSEGAAVNLGQSLSVYGNSHGFMGKRSGTRFSQSCVVIAGDGDAMQRDYWYDSARSFDELEPAEQTGAEAARRTVARLGARQIPTTKSQILFTPEIARGLLGHFVSAISGGNLYRKASFLLDSVGRQLFPESINITELPQLPRGPASAAFDTEGVATSERNIIERGVLNNYVLSSYSARRLGLETTGNAGGVRNLQLQAGASSQAELLRQMGTGLLVTEVMGQGVSILTGDYSRGATGFWVEDGEIRSPVQEVTIAANLQDIFANILAVGSDMDCRSGIQTGSVLVDTMTIAGA